jgi:hypothetical protein
MVDDMVMRWILADPSRIVALRQRPRRLPADPVARASCGAALLLAVSAGAALGGGSDPLLALGQSLGVA